MKTKQPDKRRTYVAIAFTGLLLGASIQLLVLFLMSRSVHKELWFTWTHAKEVKYARERWELTQEAAKQLYYDDYKMEGITIVKPIKEAK